MNITRNPTGKWEASIRPCGTEFGGDHHLYIDFLDKDGRDCRDGKFARVYNGEIRVFGSEKSYPEPAINIPIWANETLSVSATTNVDNASNFDSDTVSGITTSKAEEGNLYHQSFYLVFRERSAQVPVPADPPVTPPAGTDFETRRLAICAMLQQVTEMVKSL